MKRKIMTVGVLLLLIVIAVGCLEANAGADQTVIDSDGDGYALVTLDGSESYDPDVSMGSYEWYEGTSHLGSGETLDVSLAVGTHVITLYVTDNEDGTDNGDGTESDEVTITVTKP